MDRFLNQLITASGPFSRPGLPTLGAGRRNRLVENLHLDGPDLRPAGWTYPASIPSGRGGNLLASAVAEATRRLDAHGKARDPALSFSSLLHEVGKALNPIPATGGGCDFFFRAASPVARLSGRVWNVTSLAAMRYSFLGAGGAWKKTIYDWFGAAVPASLPVQPDGGTIGLCGAGSSFWLSDMSPFDLLASKGLAANSQAAAWAVLRELALPGYETAARRKQAMGLVAVEFDADRLEDRGNRGQAWKPTAIDALNYKGYCFLPGKAPDSHGLTWPLQKSLKKHEQRDGLQEFVHPHIAVPALVGGDRMVHLLGFLDAESEAAWDSLSSP